MKKKKLVISFLVIGILIVGGIATKIFLDDQAIKSREQTVEKMAEVYYENFLYDILTQGKNETELNTFFEQYKDSGLKTSISSIEKVSEIDIKNEIQSLGDSCNKDALSITIKPISPYTKANYEITAVCE